jgi:hypothetical protein
VIVQMTMTRDELFILKEMLPIWKRYADGFVFLVDSCTDGTYEFLMENRKTYNILSVLRREDKTDELWVESNERQMLYDEAFKFSNNIVCLDTDEYLDGTMTKDHLEEVLNGNPNTLIYLQWIQYTGSNTIRVDGKWENHLVDRVCSYSQRCLFKPKQMHAEHIPFPAKAASISSPHLFVSHLQWLDKRTVAVKQYYWKVVDHVNRMKYGADTIDCKEYDASVSNFVWKEISFPFPLRTHRNVYSNHNIENSYKYKFIKEMIKKHNIPYLNDWGMGIH